MPQKSQFSQSGVGMILIFLSVVIIASLFLVGGIIPGKSKNNNKDFTYSAVIDTPGDSKKTLQLKTIKFKSCGTTATVGFLVDRSGSMDFGGGTKLSNLKSGLRVFADSFPEEGVLGMQSFSSNVSLDVAFDYFKNNKNRFIAAINSLPPFGATHTKDAFEFTKAQFTQAKLKYPDRDFTLVFISDGIPEKDDEIGRALCPNDNLSLADPRYCTQDPRGALGTCRCFNYGQDPTSVAQEMKNSGVRIFTIGYVYSEDEFFKDDLKGLMERVASSREDFYPAPINNQLTTILQSITTKICKDEGK